MDETQSLIADISHLREICARMVWEQTGKDARGESPLNLVDRKTVEMMVQTYLQQGVKPQDLAHYLWG